MLTMYSSNFVQIKERCWCKRILCMVIHRSFWILDGVWNNFWSILSRFQLWWSYKKAEAFSSLVFPIPKKKQHEYNLCSARWKASIWTITFVYSLLFYSSLIYSKCSKFNHFYINQRKLCSINWLINKIRMLFARPT